MIGLTVKWDPGPGMAALDEARRALANKEEIHATVEIAAITRMKLHLTEHYVPRPNGLGAPSTGYWKSAVEDTRSTSDANSATVSISKTGVRLHYYGGVVKASGRTSEVTGRPIKFLTIPVHPGAHGRTISDLGGKGSFYIVPFGAGGGLKDASSNAGAGVFRKTGAKASASDPLYYVLKKSVTIKADPNVLPPDDAILYDCIKALASLLPGE